jgi:GEVED domain/Secretion system C-terminal sorting domain
MMTGQRTEIAPFGGLVSSPKQLGIDWNENVYNMGGYPSTTSQNINAFIVPYTYNGTVNVPLSRDVFTNPGPTYPMGSWGDCGEAYRPYCDFGDAPASYDPDPLSPAVHERDTTIRIGATWDREWVKTSSAPANADGADEDGLAYVPILNPGTSSYLATVSLYNNTGDTARVIAWLDYNGNGVFDASEACQTVSDILPSTAIQNRFLYWPSATNSLSTGSYTYLRIRLVRKNAGMTSANPTGYYNHGETEDYRVLVDNYPLSVNLQNFTAKLVTENKVELNWQSSNEENFSGFEVQRSNDNANWTALGMVDAKANGLTGIHDYTFNDNSPLKGKSYYRLKMINADGKNKQSEVRTITLRKGLEELTVTPNPAKEKAAVQLTASQDALATVTVSDMSGKILYRSNSEVRKGINTIGLPVEKLSNGTYMVQVSLNEEIITRKLVINKQ